MPVSFRKISLVLLAGVSAFGLSACGEGYEMVRTTDVAPYGNARTAGSGVMYVQAKLLPEKELNLEKEMEEEVEEEVEEEIEEIIEEAEEAEEVIEEPMPIPLAPEPEEQVQETTKELDKVFGKAQRK